MTVGKISGINMVISTVSGLNKDSVGVCLITSKLGGEYFYRWV